jgi:DNA-binding MarR family transcriptional regulator
MGLEEDIQQNKFKSPYQKLAINLVYTSNWMGGIYASYFKDEDITVQQFNVLRILRGQHPNYCNLKLIKERMLDKMSDASRITDKLVAKGLIERHVCASDRRAVNLIITKKGLALLKKLDVLDEEMPKVMKNLSTHEVETLNKLLDKLRE